MAIKIDNMRNMVLKVAWQADQHQSLRTSAALAKLYCARTAMEVIDDAIQIMGGLGYTDEARVSRFWRDVRCERIGGGTDEIMIYVAGRQILKDYQNKYLQAAQLLNKTAPPDLSGKTYWLRKFR